MLLTLLLLGLQRTSTLDRVNHRPAGISNAVFAKHYRLYWRVILGMAICWKGLFIRKVT
jgi:hypothetical protein